MFNEITDTNYIALVVKHSDTMEDGLTITVEQTNRVLDCCVDSGRFPDGTEFQMFTADEYIQRERGENEVMNFSYCGQLKYEDFDLIGSKYFPTRADLMGYITSFMLEHNHF